MNRNRLPLLATTAATAAVLAAGCGDRPGDPYRHAPAAVADANARLRDRPTLAEAESRVTDAIRQIADVAVALSPTLRWEPGRDREQHGCGGAYATTDGRTVETRFLVSRTPIPDADWPHVLRAARDLAAATGLTRLQVHVEQPGRHDVSLSSDGGDTIHLDSLTGAVLRARTGCRLSAATGPNP
ncbi:LppA family lipoprotein [Rhodococcus kronopolitis]|uniref:LppA family lipoprotein n=1 Tax=Rhodococcus kronopolitis TaxID=1460226 RepID=A0ABV9FV18_9NOCA